MKTLSDEALEQVADFLKALGEIGRLKILRTLHDGEKNVSEIMAHTQMNQSNVSKHLAILTSTHVVTSRKEGTSVFYRISDPNITGICSTVCRSIASTFRQQRQTLKSLERGGVEV